MIGIRYLGIIWVFEMGFEKYGQYKKDIFSKLNFFFKPGGKLLDVGCGDGSDARVFINEYGLVTYGVDVYKNDNVDDVEGLFFCQASVCSLPFEDDFFDYVFLHDVLHHIDEGNQDNGIHLRALREIKRVVKSNGFIIIIEGNRYNPIFYPHMVKKLGHEHWKQSYFVRVISQVFDNVVFDFFEAHAYPKRFIILFKFYEWLMENFSPKSFLSYNVAVINNE